MACGAWPPRRRGRSPGQASPSRPRGRPSHHLAPALAAAHRVIAPSAAVLAEARTRGYDPEAWQIVPNPLLVDPDQLERPDAAHREQLRRDGPVRIVARLGAEKGVASLLAAATPDSRPVQVVLAPAGFEAERGSQEALLASAAPLPPAPGWTCCPPWPGMKCLRSWSVPP